MDTTPPYWRSFERPDPAVVQWDSKLRPKDDFENDGHPHYATEAPNKCSD